MTDLLFHVLVWPTFGIALLVFGFAPGALLRLIVLLFYPDDPRRQELRSELYHVPRIERLFWVAEQLEVALVEGLGVRLRWAATGRIIDRWHLGVWSREPPRTPEHLLDPVPGGEGGDRAGRDGEAHVQDEGRLGRADVGRGYGR